MSNLRLPAGWHEQLLARRNEPVPKWLRVLGWIWFGFTAIGLIAALSIAVLWNNPRFHNYLLRTAEAQASDSLAVPVHLQNFAIHLPSLSADLYGLTIEGAAPYANPPLLQVDHVSASLRIVSLLRKSWYLQDVRVDRPIAHIFVDEKGVSNLPKPRSSGSSSNTSIFDLAVRHALLDQGEVYYNDKPTPLSAEVKDLTFLSTFDTGTRKYTGTASYADGKLLYGSFQPVSHNLAVAFAATPTDFVLTNAKLTVGESQVNLAATLHNYSQPIVSGTYDVSIDGQQIARVMNVASAPTGTLRTNGSIQYQYDPNVALLNAVSVHGQLSSSALSLQTPTAHAAISDLAGRYSLVSGNAEITELHANAFGGKITIKGEEKNLGGDAHGSAAVTLTGVSLDAVQHVVQTPPSLKQINLAGGLNADATANWGKTFDDLVAHLNASINGDVKRSAPSRTRPSNQALAAAGNTTVPVNSVIHATYTAKNQGLALDQSYLRTSHTNLTLNGTVSTHSSLNLQLQADDLREFQTIASLVQPPSATQPFNIAGAASFKGAVQGSIAAPHLTGNLQASNLQFNGSSWKTIRTGVDLSPSSASLQNAYLEPASHGHIGFSASTGLHKWSFTDASPIQLTMQADKLDITELLKLAGQDVPVSGTLAAAVSLHGTTQHPIGNGNVQLTNLAAYEQPVQSVKFNFAGNGDKVDGDLTIHLPAGTIQGKGTVNPQQKTYTAEVSASGIELGKLQAVKSKNLDMTGVLGLTATGHGTFDNPQMDATLQIPTLKVQSQAIADIKLQMGILNRIANATLTSSAANTDIQARAKIDLTGDMLTDASIDTKSIPLQPLLAAYAPDQAGDFTGQTELHATLHGPLKKKESVEAHLNIPVLNVAYGKTLQLAETAPIRIDYKDGIVNVQKSSIKGTDTDLQFQGSIPVNGTGAMSLVMLGKVNLQIAQAFDPDVRTAGEMRFNIDSHGPVDSSEIGGEIDIVDASYASADLPIGVQHGNGVLKVTKDRINISSFNAAVGGGTLTAQGGIAYRPTLQFDMGLSAKGVRLLYPQGMRENFEANLRLAGTPDNATLGGSVDLADLSFTPAFDLNSFIGQFSDTVSSPPSQGFAQNLQLNIGLRSTSSVNLISRTLSIGGSANLQVKGTAAEPVLLGRVNLNNGDIILNGTRFVLNGGTIQFINPAETQPVVNLSVSTTIQQYNIGLRFNGPVSQLQTEYSSDPALPSADIIHLLAFGETTEASAANATPTNQAAESLVASQVSSQVTSRVSKIAGISQLSISPVLAGSSSQGPPGAVITVQQRVTGNLFVNFSTNVASTQSQTIQGQYRVSPKLSVSATRDPNGGFAFDALIKKSW